MEKNGIILLDTETLDELVEKVSQRIIQELNGPSVEPQDYWFDNDQLCNYLKISKRTLQSYRDKNMIRFKQVGAKIWYKADWIQEFLEGE